MEHYYSADPSSLSEEKQIRYELEGQTFRFGRTTASFP